MKNLTNNQIINFDMKRNMTGDILQMNITLNEKQTLHLFNNGVNELGKLEARKGFHTCNIPITLSGKDITCTASVPTLLSILRKWLVENIIEASTLTHHSVSVMCSRDAAFEDFENLVIKESRMIRRIIQFNDSKQLEGIC